VNYQAVIKNTQPGAVMARRKSMLGDVISIVIVLTMRAAPLLPHGFRDIKD
jgi:hypothetical protein